MSAVALIDSVRMFTGTPFAIRISHKDWKIPLECMIRWQDVVTWPGFVGATKDLITCEAHPTPSNEARVISLGHGGANDSYLKNAINVGDFLRRPHVRTRVSGRRHLEHRR